MTAGVLGAAYVITGVLGFFLGSATQTVGLMLGLFPVNLVHNAFHLCIGAAGVGVFLAAAGAAVVYVRCVGVIFAVLAIGGIFVPQPLGLMPIGGFDIGLHALTAAVLLYVGFAANPGARSSS
jgi:hypothetical protein